MTLTCFRPITPVVNRVESVGCGAAAGIDGVLLGRLIACPIGYVPQAGYEGKLLCGAAAGGLTHAKRSLENPERFIPATNKTGLVGHNYFNMIVPRSMELLAFNSNIELRKIRLPQATSNE